jgi:serine/threonine protein kinase
VEARVSDEVLGDVDGFTIGFESGARIAGYRLESRIGRGGMAEVFLARDERLGRQVALKILAPSLAADDGFRQRFIRESRAAAAVDDPHIVPVYEAGESDGVLFIAMRFVPGGDARSLVQREGPLPPWRAAAIISPVASALDAAHAAGLLHRDVKPANMLVDTVRGRPDHVYLSDFGLSKAAAVASVGLTRKGEFLGTPEYVSPEQIAGQQADGRADEYALACSAFELLTGAPPFRRDDAVALMYAHMQAPPPRLTSLRPDLPAAVDGVVAKALAKSPADRYPSCQAFTEALRAALGLQPYDSGPASVPADRLRTETAMPRTPVMPQAAVPGFPGQPTMDAGVPPGYQPGSGPTSPGPYAPSDPGLYRQPEPSPYAPSDPRPYQQPDPGPYRQPDPGAYRQPDPGAYRQPDPGAYRQPDPGPYRQPDPGPYRQAGPFGPSGPGGGMAQPPRRPRRRGRVVAAATAAVAVLAVVGVTGGILGSHHNPPAPQMGSFAIAAASPLAKTTGDVYVVYNAGNDSSATLSGQIPHVTSGEVAQLYAQQFPYDSAPTRAGSAVLNPSGSTAAYSFQVTPTLATRYKVELFQNSSETTPLASSPNTTVYVAVAAITPSSQTCARPVCTETLTSHVYVPPPALKTEMAKRWYTYFNLVLAPVVEPAPPTLLLLGDGNPHVDPSTQIAPNEYQFVVTFQFTIGTNAYYWRWTKCTIDTEAQDGIGLPGSHGCGAPSTNANQSYLG